MKKKNENFEWLEVCRYKIDSYSNRYNNNCYNVLKRNNIECLNQLEFYFVDNVDKDFYCTLFVQKEDYERGINLLKEESYLN